MKTLIVLFPGIGGHVPTQLYEAFSQQCRERPKDFEIKCIEDPRVNEIFDNNTEACWLLDALIDDFAKQVSQLTEDKEEYGAYAFVGHSMAGHFARQTASAFHTQHEAAKLEVVLLDTEKPEEQNKIDQAALKKNICLALADVFSAFLVRGKDKAITARFMEPIRANAALHADKRTPLEFIESLQQAYKTFLADDGFAEQYAGVEKRIQVGLLLKLLLSVALPNMALFYTSWERLTIQGEVPFSIVSAHESFKRKGERLGWDEKHLNEKKCLPEGSTHFNMVKEYAKQVAKITLLDIIEPLLAQALIRQLQEQYNRLSWPGKKVIDLSLEKLSTEHAKPPQLSNNPSSHFHHKQAPQAKQVVNTPASAVQDDNKTQGVFTK